MVGTPSRDSRMTSTNLAMMSLRPKSLGVNTSATPSALSRAASDSGMMPPTMTGMSPAPASRSPSSTSGTSSMCEPDRIEMPTRWTSSETAAATICAGVSRMPW